MNRAKYGGAKRRTRASGGREFLVKMSWSKAETKFSLRTGDQFLFNEAISFCLLMEFREELNRAKYGGAKRRTRASGGREFLVKMSWSKAETKFSLRTGDQFLFIKPRPQSVSFGVFGFCGIF